MKKYFILSIIFSLLTTNLSSRSSRSTVTWQTPSKSSTKSTTTSSSGSTGTLSTTWTSSRNRGSSSSSSNNSVGSGARRTPETLNLFSQRPSTSFDPNQSEFRHQKGVWPGHFTNFSGK